MSLSNYEVGPVMATADMKAAREFYEDKLGLSPSQEPDEDGVPYVYPCKGETAISVYLSPEHAGKSTATMVGWAVDDVEKVVDELTENGVSFEQYGDEGMETDEKGIIAGDGFRVAFFRDPDGNTHSLNGS
jgi:catechol 2,3-dioxygenase-like lactoylglutathione lyase family enzyme